MLEITDASEGVEIFVNSQSAGIQIVPPYIYDISGLIKPQENKLIIEVATTLERENGGSKGFINKVMGGQPASSSGISGQVKLFMNT